MSTRWVKNFRRISVMTLIPSRTTTFGKHMLAGRGRQARAHRPEIFRTTYTYTWFRVRATKFGPASLNFCDTNADATAVAINLLAMQSRTRSTMFLFPRAGISHYFSIPRESQTSQTWYPFIRMVPVIPATRTHVTVSLPVNHLHL